MPIHGYPGNVITANPTAPTVNAASGVWTTEQQLIAVAAGNWPFTIPTQQISRSLRFNPADTAYLNRTLGSSNRRTFTFSAWVKRSLLASDQHLLGCINFAGGGSTNQQFGIVLAGGDYINVFHYNNGTYQYYPTAALYRDVSSWYHFVIAVDTTQATGSNRVKIYANGVLQATSGAVDISQNTDLFINSGLNTGIGVQVGTGTGNSYYFGGYMAEVYFIDGQQLTPSSFGRTSTTTGVWEPLAYTGTYGTNGFYLNFSDNSGTTSTTLGKDSSGNGNNWTPNNFSVTAGTGNDSMVDSPSPYGTDTGAGGEVRGNYCTLNPLKNEMTLSNGNLAISGGLDTTTTATMAVPSTGKWYFEFVPTSMPASNANIGLASSSFNITNATFAYAEHRVYIQSGNKADGSGSVAYGASWTTSDVIGVAVDMDAGTLVFYKNNTSQGTAFSDLVSSGKTWFPLAANYGSGTFEGNFNFGQRAFAYTAPSGFKALCTQNLPTPTIGATSTTQANKYMDVTLYTGNGAVRSITNSGSMQPDFVWDKLRSGANSHRLFDAVRGVEKALYSNLTNAEATETGTLTSFNSNGFSLGTNSETNTNGSTYVAWQWNAGGSNATNTSGTITSTVRANTTSGFSIVQWTGSGANGTVGHGLGVAPQFMFMKNKTNSGTGWPSYHAFMDASAPQNYYISMASTDAKTSASNAWNNTAPTSSVFSVGSSSFSNGGTMIAYVFAPVAGYSAFGSYTGNGSTDGPFIYTGFKPNFVMVKQTNTSGNSWWMFDGVRSPTNAVYNRLAADLSDAEYSNSSTFDFLSNGFKLRFSDTAWNGSGSTYIYACFAASPFKYSLAR